MMPIKGLEYGFEVTNWTFGISFGESDYPSIITFFLGPFHFSINKSQYWRNGII